MPKGIKPGSKRDQVNQEQRREKVAELYLAGMLQKDIGAALGISQPTVSNDLEVIRAKWVGNAVMSFDQRKSVELAEVRRVELEAWDAWERSKEEAEFRRRKLIKAMYTPKDRKGVPVGKPRMVVTGEEEENTAKGQVGDPRFLEIALKCREIRLKAFGILKDVNVTQNTLNVNGPPDGFWEALASKNVDEKWEDAEILKIGSGTSGEAKKA